MRDVGEDVPDQSGQAIFGDGSSALTRRWLDRHVRTRLDGTIDAVIFEAGDIGAVFGLRLTDGREVVLKAFRPGNNMRRLRAVAGLQNRLAAEGFGAAAVLDGPSSTEGIIAVVEERLLCTSSGNPHHAATRAVMAGALARQIDLLRALDGSALVDGRPGWANWQAGAWPRPHDPIFDFSTPVEGFEWVDDRADAAASVLRATDSHPAVIGHSDWVWQNVCIHDGHFVAGYDWDSLIFAPEASIVGLAAGAFTQGSAGPYDPSPTEITAFIEDYQEARQQRFSDTEHQAARAAATWVRCYNARVHLDNLHHRNISPPAGSFIDQLTNQAR